MKYHLTELWFIISQRKYRECERNDNLTNQLADAL